MRLLDKYMLFSSVIALFTEGFVFHYQIDWKLFYVILFINFILLSTRIKLSINKNILVFIAFILAHGIISYLWLNNPIKSLGAQLLGVSFCSVYYYNFLKYYGTTLAFKKYLDVAFFMALLAILMFYANINVFIYNRLNGLLTEPAHYAAIMLPATYAFFRNKNYFRLIIVLVTIFLSNSSIGYIGLVLILFFPLLKERYLIKYLWIVLVVIGLSAFYLSTQWNKPINENESNALVRRLKETNQSLNSIYDGEFERYTNLSSYAFLSNAFITRNIFLEKPLGTGFGSYPYEYDKYYALMNPPPYLIELNQSKINRTDANSLIFRMLGDLGIFAILIFIYFTYRSIKLFKNDEKIIAQSSFFYLIVKLIREGHYFPPEFYFFLLIFLKEFDEGIAHS